MDPRVAYWTSTFETGVEAVANEVALLRRRFPRSVAWGLSHRHSVLLSRKRGYCLNPRFHLLFRAAVRLLEPAFQLNHVFGSLGDWFYLQAARRRPTVLTVATQSTPVEKALLDRVQEFVVEHPPGKDELVRLGVDPGRVRLILPPVDLRRFAPAAPPGGPFTVLFASSPDRADWLEARGVPLLLEAAARRPHMRFRLLWRPWGDSLPCVRRLIAERSLANVEVAVGYNKQMPRCYREAHVTAAPFTDLDRAKPAPNSVIESLACGRPVLITEAVGLAGLVRDAAAGRVSAVNPEELAGHLDCLEADWGRYARESRRLAERCFGQEHFLTAYGRLYDEVLRL